MSKKATAEAAAEPTAVSTVRVLNDDKTWRQRRSDEESEEGLKIEMKKLLTLAVQVCAQSPDASPPAQLICSLRAQIARKKGAPLQVKKLRLEHLIFKKGCWCTSASHVGTNWYEEKNSDAKDEVAFNGDIIKEAEAMTDSERSKCVMPNLLSFNGVYETIRSALENGVLQAKHIGKGSSFGQPYPDGAEVDEVANHLYGAPPLPRRLPPPCLPGGPRCSHPPTLRAAGVCGAGSPEFQDAVVKLKGPDFDIHEFLGGALPYLLTHYVDKCV